MTVEVATEKEDKDKMIGETLAGRYQIEVRLGEGAMGSVYKARHVKVGRPFAVKVLHSKLLDDKKVMQRFEREAELAGRLRHPNVVGVVDVGEMPDGGRYMVMDFAEGQDLATLLNEAPMPPQRIAHLTRQMLEGLYHAHEAGLIHRDFKPENVIVERDDHGTEVPRIVDFGIAILRDGGESPNASGRLTTNGLVLGTPHYMAPEQAVADPIDHRIDLFALGIVVYEMLCGKLPFDGTGAEVARANLLLDPPLIAQRVPYLEVDPLLEAFARRMMAKKRDQRPATAKAAREILDLIERDRAAAAAALGVPLQGGPRLPSVTEPLSPQRTRPDTPGDLAIPTAGAAPTTAPRATDMEAPPVAAHFAVADRPGSRQHAIPTDMVPPIDESAPSKRRWAMIGGGAVLAAAVVVAIAMMGGGGDSKPTEGEKVTMTPTALEPTPPAPPTPEPQPTATEPTATEPTATEPTATEPTATESTEPAEIVMPTEKATPIKRVRPKQQTKPKDQTAAVAKTPDPKTPEVAAKQPDMTVTKAPDPTKPVDAEAAARNHFIALYQSVGRDMKALGPKGEDLVPKYRLVNYSKALFDTNHRVFALGILNDLQKTIAARKN